MTRLSNSSVDKYNTCAKMYKYHYIDRIRSSRKSSPLLFGIAIDEALNHLVVNKDVLKANDIYEDLMLTWKYDYTVDFLTKDKDIQVIPEDVLEFLESEYSEQELHHQLCWHSLWYKGLEFIFSYIDQILPRLGEIVEVQRKISLKNSEGDEIIGYQDVFGYLDGELTIIDNKTSSSSYSAKKIEQSQQLHLYSHAENIQKIAYIVMRKDYNSKGEMRPIQVLKHDANPEVTSNILDLFDETLENIKEGNFPKTKNKYTCTNHFGKPCIYYDICKKNLKLNDVPNLQKIPESKEIKK